MSKKIKGSYLLNAVGVALVFALLTGLFAANAFGTSTTYIQGIGSSQAKHYIDKLDRYRESYYKYHTGRQWKRVENYNLCLDSAAIGLDNCVELIKKVIELKFDVKAK